MNKLPALPSIPNVTLDEMKMVSHLDIAVYVHDGNLCITQGSGENMELVMVPMAYVDRFSNAVLSCAMRYHARRGLN